MSLIDQEKVEELQKSIDTLARFSACIQSYMSFWNRINMGQEAQETGQGLLVHKFNLLRQRRILETWKDIRKDYVAYTRTVCIPEHAVSF